MRNIFASSVKMWFENIYSQDIDRNNNNQMNQILFDIIVIVVIITIFLTSFHKFVGASTNQQLTFGDTSMFKI